jgi:hypothetical protein
VRAEKLQEGGVVGGVADLACRRGPLLPRISLGIAFGVSCGQRATARERQRAHLSEEPPRRSSGISIGISRGPLRLISRISRLSKGAQQRIYKVPAGAQSILARGVQGGARGRYPHSEHLGTRYPRISGTQVLAQGSVKRGLLYK